MFSGTWRQLRIPSYLFSWFSEFEARNAIRHDLCQRGKLRIITIDRPGHGESDFNPTGTILTVTRDVRELITQLHIPQFSVAGMSAGAPFALGISTFFPEKIENQR